MNKATIRKITAVIVVVLLFCTLFSGCTAAPITAPEAGGDATAQSGGIVATLLPFVALIAVFYFFMIRPEKKRKKKVEELRSSLGLGDDIVTIGGMTGKIVSVTDDTATFETGEDRVRIQILKSAIARKAK